MTPRQKRFIVALAIADGIVIVTLAVLMTASPITNGQPRGLPLHATASARSLSMDWASMRECQWRATQMLAQSGLGGTVSFWHVNSNAGRSLSSTISNGLLRFEIDQPDGHSSTSDQGTLPPPYGEEDAHMSPEVEMRVADAAQLVWTAFDIALALQEEGGECAVFTRIEVSITVHSDQADAWIVAEARTADLMAFSAGELSEDEFINLVTYTTGVAHRP